MKIRPASRKRHFVLKKFLAKDLRMDKWKEKINEYEFQ